MLFNLAYIFHKHEIGVKHEYKQKVNVKICIVILKRKFIEV